MRARKIKISNVAAGQLQQISSHIVEEWSETANKEFLQKVYRVARIAAQMPETFPASSIREVRRCVITHQTSMIYRYTKTQLTIVAFIDNRRQNK